MFDPAGLTARTALLPEAADRAGIDLERVNAVTEVVWGVAFLVGPGVGGTLIAVLGATSTLWVTAGAFAVAVVASIAVRVPGADRPLPGERPTRLVRTFSVVTVALFGSRSASSGCGRCASSMRCDAGDGGRDGHDIRYTIPTVRTSTSAVSGNPSRG